MNLTSYNLLQSLKCFSFERTEMIHCLLVLYEEVLDISLLKTPTNLHL